MELVCCVPCERFEAKQITVRNLWRRVFLDGKLTVAKAEELEFDEQALIGDLKHHQAVEHDHLESVRRPAAKASKLAYASLRPSFLNPKAPLLRLVPH